MRYHKIRLNSRKQQILAPKQTFKKHAHITMYHPAESPLQGPTQHCIGLPRKLPSEHPHSTKNQVSVDRVYIRIQEPIHTATHKSLQKSMGNQHGRQRSFHSVGKDSEPKKGNNQQNNQYQKVQVEQQSCEKVMTVPVNYCAMQLDNEGCSLVPQRRTCKQRSYQSMKRFPANRDNEQAHNKQCQS
jgi:hypothetical protein